MIPFANSGGFFIHTFLQNQSVPSTTTFQHVSYTTFQEFKNNNNNKNNSNNNKMSCYNLHLAFMTYLSACLSQAASLPSTPFQKHSPHSFRRVTTRQNSTQDTPPCGPLSSERCWCRR